MPALRLQKPANYCKLVHICPQTFQTMTSCLEMGVQSSLISGDISPHPMVYDSRNSLTLVCTKLGPLGYLPRFCFPNFFLLVLFLPLRRESRMRRKNPQGTKNLLEESPKWSKTQDTSCGHQTYDLSNVKPDPSGISFTWVWFKTPQRLYIMTQSTQPFQSPRLWLRCSYRLKKALQVVWILSKTERDIVDTAPTRYLHNPVHQWTIVVFTGNPGLFSFPHFDVGQTKKRIFKPLKSLSALQTLWGGRKKAPCLQVASIFCTSRCCFSAGKLPGVG